jgi:hypothetical protein
MNTGRLIVSENSKRIVADDAKRLAKNMIAVTFDGKILVKSDYFYN